MQVPCKEGIYGVKASLNVISENGCPSRYITWRDPSTCGKNVQAYRKDRLEDQPQKKDRNGKRDNSIRPDRGVFDGTVFARGPHPQNNSNNDCDYERIDRELQRRRKSRHYL